MNKLRIFLLVGLSVTVLSSCASSPNAETESSGATNSNKQAANKIQFSNLSELSYTSSPTPYKITPHDLIDIQVFQAEELSKEVRVNPNGYISLPLINKIRAAGLTQEQLQASIENALKKDFLQNPQVTVFIKEYTNQRVTVSGDVKQPGVFPIMGEMSLLQAVAKAGGLDDLAKPTEVILFRQAKNKQAKAYRLDLKSINKGEQRDPYLQTEDKVIVQRSGTRQWLRDIQANIPFVGGIR